jgi:alanine racemase
MTFSPETTRAWVDVDLAALVANARTVATVSGSRLLPMVKANGYGLGAVEVARALETVDPWGFGVASPAEGESLRAAGIVRPILVVTPLLTQWIDECLRLDLRPTIGDTPALEAWTGRSSRPFHVEIDSGMSRAGIRWDDRSALTRLRSLLVTATGWEGMFTHFHSAETDSAATLQQWQRFHEVVGTLPRRPPLLHAANSAAALQGTSFAGDLVRPGIFLYGGVAGTAEPRPVVSLRARVVAVRSIAANDTVGYGAIWRSSGTTTVATVAIGYADGFPRSAPLGYVPPAPRQIELNGRLSPLLGRVTMDMCMVAADGKAAVGDVATIFGGLVSLDRHAESAGTISYEILTRLGPRVARRYGRLS